jgi:hypothetical protein
VNGQEGYGVLVDVVLLWYKLDPKKPDPKKPDPKKLDQIKRSPPRRAKKTSPAPQALHAPGILRMIRRCTQSAQSINPPTKSPQLEINGCGVSGGGGERGGAG